MRRLKFPLHVAILITYSAVFLVGGGLIIGYNYLASSQQADSIALTTLRQNSRSILDRLNQFFEPAFSQSAIQAHQYMGQSASGVMMNSINISREIEVLTQYPWLYSIYSGSDAGEFSQVLNLGNFDGQLRQNLNAPDQADFAVREIQLSSRGPRTERWTFLDNQRRKLKEHTFPAQYDPRTRPWYSHALAGSGPTVSAPYLFESNHKPGVTISQRLSGKTIGVAGVDVNLDEFTQFLQNTIVGPDGYTAILNRDGRVFVSSRLDSQAAGDRSGLVRVGIEHLADLNDPVPKELAKHLHPTASAAESFEVGGKTYLTVISGLPDVFGPHTILAVVASKDQFTVPYTRIRDRSVLVSLLVLIGCVPVIWWVASQISRPVKKLLAETEHIRSLNLDRRPAVPSRFAEISSLADSIEDMKGGLSTFAKYVPKTLVLALLKAHQEPKLGGADSEITILFTDVKGFTHLTEGMAPQDVMLKTSAYFQEIGNAIMENNGTIDKFIGDCVMAFWNAPIPNPDHVSQAVRAVLAARQRNAALNARWESFGWPAMVTRFGLHSGVAIVGNVGSPDRMNYTVLGETVNLASRLEGLNKFYGTQILVSEPVCAATSSTYLYRTVDLVQPSGFSSPIRIYELLGARDLGDEFHAPNNGQRLVERWDAVMNAYGRHDWPATLALITRFLDDFPEDSVARVYHRRCGEYQFLPPDSDWDGVTVYTNK